jgi:hypothetical protein
VVTPAASTSRSRAVSRRRSGTSRSGGFAVIAARGEVRPAPRVAAATTVAAPGAAALGGDTQALPRPWEQQQQQQQQRRQ